MDKLRYHCDKCNFNTNYKSQWDTHITTKKHQKLNETHHEINNKNFDSTCKLCNYVSNKKVGMTLHYLNNHASIKERKEQFKYYCETCNYGNITQSHYNIHINSIKHILKQTFNVSNFPSSSKPILSPVIFTATPQ
jgi:hypothetical protein